MKSKLFQDFCSNEKIDWQNREILLLINEINYFLWDKFYGNLLINSLSFIWKTTFSNPFTLHEWDNIEKNISDMPWIEVKSPYWKDIYNFKQAYNYLIKFDELTEKSLVFVNNILNDVLRFDYERVKKQIKSQWKVIYESPSWKELEEKFDEFIKLLNKWIDWWYSSSYVSYIYFIFIIIHPFFWWNWRTSRVLVEYLFTKKMWLKYPSIFFHFYLNNNKAKHYDICRRESFLEFAEEFNTWIINQLKISLQIYKDIENFIQKRIEEWKNNWINEEKIFREIYKNLYFENAYPYFDDKLEKVLLYLTGKKYLEYYMHEWRLYYYDTEFINVFRKKY